MRSVSCFIVALSLSGIAGLLSGISGCRESPVASADSGAARSQDAPTKAVDTSRDSGDKDEKTTTVAPVAATPAPKSDALVSINFDDIKFQMEKTDVFKRAMVTEKIEGYAGRNISIRGFILPSYKQDGLTEFVLVRDNLECCFGPGAALYDCVMVRMLPGKSTSFSIRPVAVVGEFSISEWKDFDGVTRAIYHLQGQRVY